MLSAPRNLDLLVKEAKGLLNELEEKVSNETIKVSTIADKAIGIGKAKKLLNVKDDFQGIYLFIENKKPMYVATSSELIDSVQQHIKTYSHHSVSLAYEMARNRVPIKGKQEDRIKNPKFKKTFDEAKDRILRWKFAYLEISDDDLLYLLEFFAAKHFATKYNSFRPH